MLDATESLTPNGPVIELINAGTIGTPVSTPLAVSGSSDGFLVVCEDGHQNLDTLFFDIGSQMWEPLIQTPSSTTNISNGTNSTPLISNSTSGAMISWLGDTVGYNEGYAYAGFTPDHGNSWTTILPLESISPIVVNVAVSGTSDGYMFTWLDGANNTLPIWAWSTFNGSAWVVSASGTIPNPPNGLYSSPAVSGTFTTGFMSVWVAADDNVYASYSANEGTNWSTQQLTMTGNSLYAWVAENANGFLAVWVDSSYNVWSNFYDLGSGLWQNSSQQFAGGLSNGFNNTPYATGDGGNFLVSWVGIDSNAYATVSTNNGTTWSPPTQITTDGSVATQSPVFLDYVWLVGNSLVGDTALFTWTDSSGNGQSRFYTLTSPVSPPATLNGAQVPNNFPFQREFLNNLRWTASPTFDVVSYNIYRNGILIGSVPAANTLVYNDLSITIGTGYTYGVTSVDTNQDESSAITVFVQ